MSGDGTNELVFSYQLKKTDTGQIKAGLRTTKTTIANKYGFSATDTTKHTVGFIGEIKSGAAITEMFAKMPVIKLGSLSEVKRPKADLIKLEALETMLANLKSIFGGQDQKLNSDGNAIRSILRKKGWI